MKAILNPELKEYYLERMRSYINGDIEVPATKYEYTLLPDKCHASELDCGGCFIAKYYRRILPESPPSSEASLCLFWRGRNVERPLAIEGEAVEKEGILCRADDPIKMTEIKSCWKDMDNFEPLDKYKGYTHWLERIMTYAYAYGQNWWNLFVMFMLGNVWTSNFGRKKEYVRAGTKTWRLEFTDDELQVNWEEMQRRKTLLLNAVNDGGFPWDVAEQLMPEWLCHKRDYEKIRKGQKKIDCPHIFNCEFFDSVIMG